MPGEFRALPVPEGLEGMRVDAAIAKAPRSVALRMSGRLCRTAPCRRADPQTAVA